MCVRVSVHPKFYFKYMYTLNLATRKAFMIKNEFENMIWNKYYSPIEMTCTGYIERFAYCISLHLTLNH